MPMNPEGNSVNRQIGDYVVCSNEANVAPFYVRMAGESEELSEHPNVTAAVRTILRYQKADKQRARAATKTGYRVVYGETRPAWEKILPTMREAKAFAKQQRSFGDVIFSVKKVVPGEKPQSITAAIDAARAGQ